MTTDPCRYAFVVDITYFPPVTFGTADSLQTRSSAVDFVSGDPYYMQGNIYQRKPKNSGHHAEKMKVMRESSRLPARSSAGEDVQRSLAKADQRLQIEQKLHAARRRRDAHLRVREASSRAANTKHAQVSRAAAERRSVEDVEREERSFRLERGSAEQVLLRKVSRFFSTCGFPEIRSLRLTLSTQTFVPLLRYTKDC